MKTTKNGLVCDIDYLHQKSELVDLTNKEEVEHIKKTMTDMFYAFNGKMQGMAAVQCGILKRAILLRYKKGDEPIIAFNPKIYFKFGFDLSNEGCLSEDDIRYWVRRPSIMIGSYYREDGSKKIVCLDFKKARIFCHECDHLDGILLQDKGKLVNMNRHGKKKK